MDIHTDSYQMGLVKWFGGYNHQKDRKNDYGFIDSRQGQDLFVHKNEIQNGSELTEGELVVFETGEKKGKQYAKNVHRVSNDSSAAIIAFRLHFDFEGKEKLSRPSTFADPVLGMMDRYLKREDNEFISFLRQEAHQRPDVFDLISSRWSSIFVKIVGKRSISELINFGVSVYDIPRDYIGEHKEEFIDYVNKLDEDARHDFLKTYISCIPTSLFENDEFISLLRQTVRKHPEAFGSIKVSSTWSSNFHRIIGEWSISELLGFGVHVRDLPKDYVDEHEEALFNYINELDQDTRQGFLNENVGSLPIFIILACEFKRGLIRNDLLATRTSEIKHMILRLFGFEDKLFGWEDRRAIPLPEYALETLRSSYNETNLRSPESLMWLVMEPLLFKKHLFNQGTNIKKFFDESLFLRNKIEFFILANLFPLIQANNDLDTAYTVFLHHLWESLVAEEISFEDEGVFNLFPSCTRMGPRLSCEAFYWKKSEDFLCRGRTCGDPQVLPSSDKHYLDFNIYDWFKHFGVNYSIEDQPSKKDFPVKLAGYINRLKEIFGVLHCRACEKLMKPDMRYARVEYQEYRDGKLVTVNTSAAYRATVFECGNSQCTEYENKYYINHCIGFGCDSLIDSRDAKLKCEVGLYICIRCGSCCSEHGESKPVGLCPECGSALILFENIGDRDRYGKYARYVQCSKTGCDFEIVGELPKKFYMEWCKPVRQVNHAPKIPKYRQSNICDEDYIIPF